MGGFGTQEKKSRAGKKSSDHGGKPFPQRRHLPCQGIAIPEQKGKLMGQQSPLPLSPAAGPPAKAALAQPLLTKPEPLAVIGEDFDGGGPLVSENKHDPREGIGFQDLPAYPGQSIDALPEV